MTYRIAHISDLHLPPLPEAGLASLANKRLLGYLSWHRKRKYRHRKEVIAALETDLSGRGADHICITGDITNLGLPQEFESADRWLRTLGSPHDISFVPGNHDVYVAASRRAMGDRFGNWLADAFPFVTRRGPVTFIGVSTAVATPPLLATGRIGRAQRDRLQTVLDDTANHGFRVLLLHHPPGEQVVGRRKSLNDAAALRSLLYYRPVDLVLHGHGHHAVHYFLPSAIGRIPVFGAGSASLSHPVAAGSGHYHMFELQERSLRVTHRCYQPANRVFEAGDRLELARNRREA